MMEDYTQFSAKTKNEAITKACIELGASSDQLDIVVVSEGSSGFFGIGSKPAVIKARKTAVSSDEEEIQEIVGSVKLDSIKREKRTFDQKQPAKEKQKPQKKEKPQPKAHAEKPVEKQIEKSVEKPEEKAPAAPVMEAAAEDPVEKNFEKQAAKPEKKEKVQKERQPKEKAAKPSKPVEILTDEAQIAEVEKRGEKFLREVFDSMKLGEVEITSKYNRTDGCLEINFEGEDMGLLIGKRGQTLDSLQYLTSLVVNKGMANYVRVKLDTEDYRRRRKETLENLARGIAYKVRKTRRPVVLEPMNPYERRIIHSALQGNRSVETVSEGEEPYRHVVVKFKKY